MEVLVLFAESTVNTQSPSLSEANVLEQAPGKPKSTAQARVQWEISKQYGNNTALYVDIMSLQSCCHLHSCLQTQPFH